MPVDVAFWWDAPDANKGFQSYYDLDPYLFFLHNGIDMILIRYDPNAPEWPHEGESKQQKETEANEIESGDEGETDKGLDKLFHPCGCAK